MQVEIKTDVETLLKVCKLEGLGLLRKLGIITVDVFLHACKIAEGVPDWKDAPEWAQWLVHDACWGWYWFEKEPTRATSKWIVTAGRAKFAKPTHANNFESVAIRRPSCN